MYTLIDFGAMIADHIWLGATDSSVVIEIGTGGARDVCVTEPNV